MNEKLLDKLLKIAEIPSQCAYFNTNECREILRNLKEREDLGEGNLKVMNRMQENIWKENDKAN